MDHQAHKQPVKVYLTHDSNAEHALGWIITDKMARTTTLIVVHYPRTRQTDPQYANCPKGSLADLIMSGDKILHDDDIAVRKEIRKLCSKMIGDMNLIISDNSVDTQFCTHEFRLPPYQNPLVTSKHMLKRCAFSSCTTCNLIVQPFHSGKPISWIERLENAHNISRYNPQTVPAISYAQPVKSLNNRCSCSNPRCQSPDCCSRF